MCLALALGVGAAVHPTLARPGVLDDLAAEGIESSLTYDGAAVANLAGGLRRGSTYGDLLDLGLTFDLDRIFGWSGVLLYLNGLRIHGGQPGDLTGDAQGVSSIAAPAAWQIEEFWLQKNFSDERSSMLLGLYDLNTEFYRLHSAALFLNSSFGIGPELAQSGIAGPSIFPATSASLRVTYKPRPSMVMRLALVDAVPHTAPDRASADGLIGNGALLVAETALLSRPAGSSAPASPRKRLGRFSALPPYEHKLALGVWHYTSAFDDLRDIDSSGQPLRHRGSTGAYLIADATLSRHPDEPRRTTTAFVQLGVGDARVNRFGSYYGIGIVRTGLFRSRPADQTGVALAAARNGNHYVDRQRLDGEPVGRTEVAIELTHLMQVRPWLTLQPDLQFVIGPGTDPRVHDALAFTLRFEAAIGSTP